MSFEILDIRKQLGRVSRLLKLSFYLEEHNKQKQAQGLQKRARAQWLQVKKASLGIPSSLLLPEELECLEKLQPLPTREESRVKFLETVQELEKIKTLLRQSKHETENLREIITHTQFPLDESIVPSSPSLISRDDELERENDALFHRLLSLKKERDSLESALVLEKKRNCEISLDVAHLHDQLSTLQHTSESIVLGILEDLIPNVQERNQYMKRKSVIE
jgi:hypothetical protein